MTSTTVAEMAAELNKTTSSLLEQLSAAGVPKNAGTDPVTESDKQKLLGHLKASHGTAGGERKKITLVKKSTSEIKQADATGRARTIQVEVRKKRTFVKRDDDVIAPEVVPKIPTLKGSTLIGSPKAVKVYLANDWSEAPTVKFVDCESVVLTTCIEPELIKKVVVSPNGVADNVGIVPTLYWVSATDKS